MHIFFLENRILHLNSLEYPFKTAWTYKLNIYYNIHLCVCMCVYCNTQILYTHHSELLYAYIVELIYILTWTSYAGNMLHSFHELFYTWTILTIKLFQMNLIKFEQTRQPLVAIKCQMPMQIKSLMYLTTVQIWKNCFKISV